MFGEIRDAVDRERRGGAVANNIFVPAGAMARRVLVVLLALAGAERARAALARGVVGGGSGARHASRCAMRRGSALRACDSCLLPAESDAEAGSLGQEASASSRLFDVVLQALPIVLPLAAFNGYDEVLAFISWAIDCGPGNWLAVDGGKEQVSLLQPSINGVILPAISIALGTLSATTISSLRDRQITLRNCLHKEASSQ